MAITNGYATVADFKSEFFPQGGTDVISDPVIELAIESASRAIDQFCCRRFYAATETNYFTAINPLELKISDLLSVTTLATDDGGGLTYPTTWDTGDYLLYPFNAPNESVARPYTHILSAPNSGRRFPLTSRGVKVVGSFGFATTTPKQIKSATLLLALRLFKRKDAPFGVFGSPELGEVQVIPSVESDPEIEVLVRPYRRRGLI